MADPLLTHTADGGTITFVNGVLTMSDGLRNAVYLSLFGGNEDDSGLSGDDLLQWWGNLGEADPALRYRSETQYLLRSIPAIPANMRRIDEAAERDLAWMVVFGVATLVSAQATIPALNTVRLAVKVEVNGRVYDFDFTESWSVAA